jgi:two-component system, chemotaxis family, chemotaxis protein CheY
MIKKVLVVDDSELIHKMFLIMFKRYEGCKIESAKNGKEALDKLEVEKDFDVILLDINMPVMNGIQFLETVKKEKKCTNTPIIVISTEGKEDDTLKGLALGARGYIVKPFKSNTLHDLISDVCQDNIAATG